DIEVEALQSPSHQGDDEDGLDDEDGVVFTDDDGVLVPGTTTEIEVTAGTVGGVLDAFLDWNGDGDWQDAGEQNAVGTAIAAGETVTLAVPVPLPAVAGASCARFRLSTAGGLTPTGLAMDGEVEDYAVEIGTPDPVLGLGKRVLEIEQLGLGEWLVRFELTVENLGNVPISDVQIESDLADAFADAEGFFVGPVTSGELTVNPAFDGDGDILVLTGADTLDVDEVGVVILDLTVMPGTAIGPYVCSSLTTGTDPGGGEVDDPSQDGGDPDPDDDGDPNNDNDPTEILFPIPVVEIPTAGGVGLLALALLLLGAGVRRLRP
ncbi:MAG: GEVED domain-containing protein, partial [Acidobacteriota bacterium]